MANASVCLESWRGRDVAFFSLAAESCWTLPIPFAMLATFAVVDSANSNTTEQNEAAG